MAALTSAPQGASRMSDTRRGAPVLLVEDKDSLRTMLRHALERLPLRRPCRNPRRRTTIAPPAVRPAVTHRLRVVPSLRVRRAAAATIAATAAS